MYTCICMWRACGIRPQYTLSIKSLQLMVLQKIALWQKYEVQTANTAGRTRFGHLAIASIRLSTHYVNSSLIRCQTNSFEDPIKKLIRAHVFFFFEKDVLCFHATEKATHQGRISNSMVTKRLNVISRFWNVA